MFYSIDHLTTGEQERFTTVYDLLLAAEDAGTLPGDRLDRADEMLAFGAAASAGYADTFIEQARVILT